MRRRLPSRWGLGAAACVLAGIFAFGGRVPAASAQSCAVSGAASTRCRFMLSEPRRFTVLARADRAERGPWSGTLDIRVDGAACRVVQTRSRARILGGCDVALGPATHVVEAAVRSPAPVAASVGVELRPGGRLAELPREAASLEPTRRRIACLPVFAPCRARPAGPRAGGEAP